jgi:hypothetical protein
MAVSNCSTTYLWMLNLPWEVVLLTGIQLGRRAMPLTDIRRLKAGARTYDVTKTDQNFKRRVVLLWLLDFDACSDIIRDKDGVQQAVRAFLETDPYFRRPFTCGPYAGLLWEAFACRYIATSRKLLGPTEKMLPEMFIHEVTAKLQHREEPSNLASRGPPTVTVRWLLRGQ